MLITSYVIIKGGDLRSSAAKVPPSAGALPLEPSVVIVRLRENGAGFRKMASPPPRQAVVGAPPSRSGADA